MSDSFNVSAKVWPVTVGHAEVCKVVALNGLVVVQHDVDRALTLTDKAGIADFIRQVLEAHPDEVADVLKVVTEAIWFAFAEPSPVKREADPRVKGEDKTKDEMRDWLNESLGHSAGSIVKSKDLRRAWHDHFQKKHGVGSYWSAYRFHARLREYGYKVERLCGLGGTGSYIVGVFMRNGSAPSARKAKRKTIKRTAPAVHPLPISEDYAPLPFALVRQGAC